MVVTLGQEHHVGEEPTVILYTTYINRHAGTPNKTKIEDTMSLAVVTLGPGFYVIVLCLGSQARTVNICLFRLEGSRAIYYWW